MKRKKRKRNVSASDSITGCDCPFDLCRCSLKWKAVSLTTRVSLARAPDAVEEIGLGGGRLNSMLHFPQLHITLLTTPCYTSLNSILLFSQLLITFPTIPYYTSLNSILHYPLLYNTLSWTPFYTTHYSILHFPELHITLPSTPYYTFLNSILHFPLLYITLPWTPYFTSHYSILHFPELHITLPTTPYYTSHNSIWHFPQLHITLPTQRALHRNHISVTDCTTGPMIAFTEDDHLSGWTILSPCWIALPGHPHGKIMFQIQNECM